MEYRYFNNDIVTIYRYFDTSINIDREMYFDINIYNYNLNIDIRHQIFNINIEQP